MNRAIVIKASIVIVFFALVLGLAIGCSSIKDKDVTPQIDNGSDVYLNVGDIAVTNQQLWDLMKVSDGLTYLKQYVEENLLSTYIDGMSQADIDKAVENAIYGTNDQEAIAKIQADPQKDQDAKDTFDQTLILMGLDPTNPADLKEYVKMTVAKQNYTKDWILGLDDTNDLAITDEAVQSYYEDNTRGDVCALTIKFDSYNEATAVFNELNIVPDYANGIGSYFGTTPIDQMLTSGFNPDNTTELDQQETLAKFIELYNYMNPTATQIPAGTTIDQFCGAYGSDFTYNYDKLTNANSNTTEQTFASYLWDTLSSDTTDPNATRFSTDVKEIGNYQLMVFKISEADVTPFDQLTDTEVQAVRDTIMENELTTSNIQTAMDALWAQHEFEIYDPIFKLQSRYSDGTDYTNKGSATDVATLDGTAITATDLFDYMQNILGTYYTIEMVKSDSLLNSDYYTNIYGTSHDYLNSDNTTMVDHRDQLRQMKQTFSSDGYASYGFSSSDYTWDEFLVVAFGSTSEANVIRDVFVMGNLQPYLVRDMVNYQDAVAYMQKEADNYFSLNVTHLLIYLDKDFDFTPDSFNDYIDGLTPDQLTQYNTLVASFEQLVKSKINNDGYTFDQIVSEYQDSLIQDPTNVWAPFKEYGFHIMTEDLSTSGSLTYDSTVDSYDPAFVTALTRIYKSYVQDVAADSSITEYYDNQLVQSDFGLHFIQATEGDGFDQPTAVYDNANGDYQAGFVGTTVIPNESQWDLYFQIKFAEKVDDNVDFEAPTSVYNAADQYYSTIFDDYFSTTGYTIATAQYILDRDPQYTTNQTDRIEFLNNLVDILYQVGFPTEFTPSSGN